MSEVVFVPSPNYCFHKFLLIPMFSIHELRISPKNQVPNNSIFSLHIPISYFLIFFQMVFSVIHGERSIECTKTTFVQQSYRLQMYTPHISCKQVPVDISNHIPISLSLSVTSYSAIFSYSTDTIINKFRTKFLISN